MRRACSYFPDRTALVDGERHLTYAELDDLATRSAGALSRVGVTKGDRVGVLLLNCVEFVLVQHGVWQAGAAQVQMPAGAGVDHLELFPAARPVLQERTRGRERRSSSYSLCRSTHRARSTKTRYEPPTGPAGRDEYRDTVARGLDAVVDSQVIEVRTSVGTIRGRERGEGRDVLFLAGAFANGDLWRDVVDVLAQSHRCVALDLPLGAHSEPLDAGCDRSARSLARAVLECVEALALDDATVVANDTAGGLVLLALDIDHAGHGRVGRLVLTNCDNYEHFPPKPLQSFSRLARRSPRIARRLAQLSVRTDRGRRRLAASVARTPLDAERVASFFTPVQDRAVANDLVGAMAGFRPALLLEAATALSTFEKPVLLAWGDSCEFFPIAHAERLAADLPNSSIEPIRNSKTWVPVDAPAELAAAIARFIAGDA